VSSAGARLRVHGGVDIVQEKRTAREEKKAARAIEAAKIFEQCAQGYIDENWDGWSKKYAAQWQSSLKQMPTQRSITCASRRYCQATVFELLEPIWIGKRETANRIWCSAFLRL
jgi:hypothetical protein